MAYPFPSSAGVGLNVSTSVATFHVNRATGVLNHVLVVRGTFAPLTISQAVDAGYVLLPLGVDANANEYAFIAYR